MPPEGQNNSEEKLQRYAKERRERGGDFSLHPATRQVLQGEVTRQFGKTSRTEPKRWWAVLLAFPGRLAAGGAFAVIALTCLVVWNNSKREPHMQLAQAPQARSEFSLKRTEDRTWAETATDKEQSKLQRDEKMLAPAKPLSDERLLTLNAPAESDSRARLEVLSVAPAAKPSEPIQSFGADSTLSSVTVTNSVAATFSYQANPAEVRFGGSTAPAQNTAGSQPQSLATDYSASFRSRSPATGVKTDAGAFGGGLAANGPMSGIAPPQQQLAPPTLTRAEPDLAKRELALAEKLGQPLSQSSVALRSDGVVAGSGHAQVAATVSATPAPVAAPAPTAGLAGGLSDGTDTWRRQINESAQVVRFYRAPVLAGRGNLSEAETKQKSDPGSDEFRVLDRFAIEQQTNALRVVDGDGSVYEGFVDGATVVSDTEANTFNFSDGLERQKAVLAKDAIGQGQRGYSFNASGSNVTLKQFIKISGRFIAGPDATNAAGRSFSRAVATTAPVSRRAAAPTNLRDGSINLSPEATNSAAIEGVIRIGKNPQQPFRALKQGR